MYTRALKVIGFTFHLNFFSYDILEYVFLFRHPRNRKRLDRTVYVPHSRISIRPLTAFPCAMSRSLEGASVSRDSVRGRPMPPSSPLVSPSARSAGPSLPLPSPLVPFPIPRSSLLLVNVFLHRTVLFHPRHGGKEGYQRVSQSVAEFRSVCVCVCACRPRVNIEETNGVTTKKKGNNVYLIQN